MNNQAFIDGQNLKLGTFKTNPSWNVDLKRFRVYLSQKYNVNEAYYFIGAYDPKNQDLYSALQKFGYIVIFREHAESALSKKKGNVDTDIVFTVMKSLAEKEKFDKVVLVSGDGDYWRMVDYLIQKDKFEKLLAPSRKNLSSLYKRRMADTYRVYLDDPAIRSKIEFKKKQTDNQKSRFALGISPFGASLRRDIPTSYQIRPKKSISPVVHNLYNKKRTSLGVIQADLTSRYFSL